MALSLNCISITSFTSFIRSTGDTRDILFETSAEWIEPLYHKPGQ